MTMPCCACAGHAGYIHDSSSSVAYSASGRPLKPDDVPYPRSNTPLEEAVAILTMLIFFGCATPCHLLRHISIWPPIYANHNTNAI